MGSVTILCSLDEVEVKHTGRDAFSGETWVPWSDWTCLNLLFTAPRQTERVLRSLPMVVLIALLSGYSGAAPAVAGVVTHGSRTLPRVALTFDADMTPGMARALASGKVLSYDNVAVRQILRATHTPATFFLTGMWAELYPQPAREIAQDPLFEVEDHSYDHPGFAQPCFGLAPIAADYKAANVRRSQLAIARATGRTPRYFRFPGGCASAEDVAMAARLGLVTVHWDVISGDAGQTNPQVIIRNVLQSTCNGSIIVMHSHGGRAPSTALALPAIISGLKARGFSFVTIKQLLEHHSLEQPYGLPCTFGHGHASLPTRVEAGQSLTQSAAQMSR